MNKQFLSDLKLKAVKYYIKINNYTEVVVKEILDNGQIQKKE